MSERFKPGQKVWYCENPTMDEMGSLSGAYEIFPATVTGPGDACCDTWDIAIHRFGDYFEEDTVDDWLLFESNLEALKTLERSWDAKVSSDEMTLAEIKRQIAEESKQ